MARAAWWLLVRKGDPAELIPVCQNHIQGIDQDTTDLLLQVDRLPAPDQLQEHDYEVLCGPQPIVEPRFLPGIYGLPSDAMLSAGAVLHVLKHSSSAFEALKNAVYLRGDVDTIASVCCGLSSARYGIEALPEYMRTSVEGLEYIEQVAGAFTKKYY